MIREAGTKKRDRERGEKREECKTQDDRRVKKECSTKDKNEKEKREERREERDERREKNKERREQREERIEKQ